VGWKTIGAVLGAIAAIVTIVGFAMRLLPHPDISVDDAILLDHTFAGTEGSAVVRDFDPNLGPDYYIDKGQFIFAAPKIDVEITSQVDDESIKVAPYLVVDLTRVEPMPGNLDVVTIVPSESAPAVSQDWFYAIFTPQRDGRFAAVRYSDYGPDSAYKEVDYMTLKPDERKVLTLTTGTLFPTKVPEGSSGPPEGSQAFLHTVTGIGGYFYHFRVGVAYSYKGERNIKWINNEFVVGDANVASEWYVFTWSPASGYTLVKHTQGPVDFTKSGDESYRAYRLSEEEAKQEARLRNSAIPLPTEWGNDKGPP